MVDYDAEREERITMDILLDLYDEQEFPLGWYYYLERSLTFPFSALWGSSSKNSKAKSIPVVVVGMAPEEECTREVKCLVALEGDEFAVSLINLTAPEADEKTQEAIADWHYWVN